MCLITVLPSLRPGPVPRPVRRRTPGTVGAVDCSPICDQCLYRGPAAGLQPVIAAPEPMRDRFRGQKLAAMLNTAASLRVHSSWDIETASTVVALRTLARRTHAMLKE